MPLDMGVEYAILLEASTQPIQMQPYRHPKRFIDEIEKDIKQLLELGLIRTSSSPYASSVVLVNKKMEP